MGLSFYTLGQRKGLGIGGDKLGDGSPWFVLGKDLATNTLLVAQGHDHALLMSHELCAMDTSWVSGAAPAEGAQLSAKTRYRQADAACAFQSNEEGFALHFDEAQWAVTPGQSAVVYQNEICLGGGVIKG
jgi:tRNA-specific 2-thiouridylase